MENSHKPRNGDTPYGVQEISVVCESSDQPRPISGRLFKDLSGGLTEPSPTRTALIEPPAH